MLEVDGQTYDALIKEVDFNPLAGRVDEIDFQALVSNEKVHSVAEIVIVNHDKVADGVLQENMEEVNLDTVQVAQTHVEEKVEELVKEEERVKEEEEKGKQPQINGVLLAVSPVQGRITSRFGSVSSIRSGAHTGTDICCPTGTPIKAVASGTVVFAERNGSYGNLIKISHGNGVETWYAHCSELYATVGQEISAGDIIAAVGSTGNSTGPHLHLEIRVNGTAINPQKYLYK